MERWYVGGSIGQSKVKFDDNIAAVGGATASSVTKEETDTGYKLYAGHRFSRNVAVEGGWVDFGKFSARRTVTAPGAATLNYDAKISGWNIDAVGIWPLANQFAIFGRLGGLYSTLKTTRTGTNVAIAPESVSPKKSELNLHWGLGASYDFSRTIAVRAEYEQAQKVGDQATTGEGDVRLMSLGVVVKF
jgi:OOP family OmpA-OmpF porin